MKYLTLLVLLWTSAVSAQFQVDTLVEGLNNPWSVAELPDGALLISEKAGQLRLVSENGELQASPVAGLPDVLVTSQGGLMDIELANDFVTSGKVYLSATIGTVDDHALHLLRATFDGTSISEVETVLTVEPAGKVPYHYGGRILALPDGSVLLTTGDRYDAREDALRHDSMLGKVLRINADGSVPADNPFAGDDGGYGEIWTMGHRNAQALVRDPQSGAVYLNEHGPRGGDELNLLDAGNNYGWPGVTYGRDYNGASMTPYTEYPGTEQPLAYWVPSIAPSGMAVYHGDQFPEWQGDLLVTALAERSLRRIDMQDGEVVGQDVLLTDLEERLRDVMVAADGAIYVLTDGPRCKAAASLVAGADRRRRRSDSDRRQYLYVRMGRAGRERHAGPRCTVFARRWLATRCKRSRHSRRQDCRCRVRRTHPAKCRYRYPDHRSRRRHGVAGLRRLSCACH